MSYAPTQTNGPLAAPDERPARVPDFFLIGVPRAATTSLYNALGEHPRIFVPRLKEACFTCSDIDPHTHHRTATRYFSDRAEYLALFAGARPDQLVGEGCTYNVYSPAAPSSIRELSPNARILVQLRDPVEQMYSNHGLKVIMGDVGADFGRVIDAQAVERLRRTVQPVGMADYDLRDKASVVNGLERFVAEFGRDRIHVTLYEEFATRPRDVVRSVLFFLGVSDSVVPDPKVEVPHREARWDGLNRTMAATAVISRTKRLTPARLHPVARRVAAAVFRSNRRRVTRPPLPPSLRARLRDEFRPEVERLSQIVGRDLVEVWWPKEPSSTA